MGCSFLLLAAGIVWGGIVPENHLGGRVASPGYLQGKVMIVDCRDYSKDRKELERLEDFWQTYKHKPFVLVGSHRGAKAEAVKANLAAAGVTYPVYADAAFEAKTFVPKNGFIYVIQACGKMSVKTYELNRAFEAAITAISWAAAPGTAQQYSKLVDYELEVLPGRAYLRIQEMRKAFPAAASAYDEAYLRLDADEEVKKLAKLEDVTRRVVDFDPTTKRGGRPAKFSKEKLRAMIASYESLKESKNPLVVQEAKNCIADLKWAMAEM